MAPSPFSKPDTIFLLSYLMPPTTSFLYVFQSILSLYYVPCVLTFQSQKEIIKTLHTKLGVVLF